MLLSDALPSYEIGGELGRGGWGVVLGGRHRQLGRQVAIKQVTPSFAAEPEVRHRFVGEARVLASVDHPHVVRVYDFVERDGLCAIVMEFLPGGTLRTRMAGRMNAPQAVALTLACTAGVDAAHRLGVLHRDVKPENMMFAGSGVIKVTDFGLAKVVGGSMTLATRAGQVLGTPAYIAPEQARGDELTPSTDVYALATMLYEMLAGELPFPDEGNAMSLLFKHAFEPPIPLLDVVPSAPAGLASVVMQGLATDAADRQNSAEAFALALTEAATAAWGPGWLAAESVPVLGANGTPLSGTGTAAEWPAPGRTSAPPLPVEDDATFVAHRSRPAESSPPAPSPPPGWSSAGWSSAGSSPARDTVLPASVEAISLPAPPPDAARGGVVPPDGATVFMPAAAPVPAARDDAPQPDGTAEPSEGPPTSSPQLVKVVLVAVAIAVAALLLVLYGPLLFTSYSG